jgi:tetratricopeptide (TPR) repeat protein
MSLFNIISSFIKFNYPRISNIPLLTLLMSFFFISTVFASEAFLPENLRTDVTVAGDFPVKNKSQKSIVIDGALLGINNTAETSSATDDTKNKNWWKGFEKAWSDEDFFLVFLNRLNMDPGIDINPGKIMKQYHDGDIQDIYDQLLNIINNPGPLLRKKNKIRVLSDLYCCLGFLHLKTLNFTRAAEYFITAKERDSSNLVCVMLLGEAYIEQGRFEESGNVIRQIESSSYYPVKLSSIFSRLFQHKNRIDRAIYHWKRVIDRIDPGPKELFRLRFLESEQYVEREFITYSTAQYEVKYDPVFQMNHDKIISKILSNVNEARLKLNKRFGINPSDKTRIIVFSQKRMNKLMGGNYPLLEAFYSLEDGKLRIILRNDSERTIANLRPVIFHEYTHCLVHYLSRGRMRSRWMHEGIATWYERAETGIDRFRSFKEKGISSESPVDLDLLLRRVINLKGYYISREVIDLLIKRYGESSLIKFLKITGQGILIEDAWKKSFGISYDDLKEIVKKEIR